MDNNDKTFADLFSSVDEQNNDKNVDNNEKTTFDNLVSEVLFDDNENIRFGNISDIINEQSELNNNDNDNLKEEKQTLDEKVDFVSNLEGSGSDFDVSNVGLSFEDLKDNIKVSAEDSVESLSKNNLSSENNSIVNDEQTVNKVFERESSAVEEKDNINNLFFNEVIDKNEDGSELESNNLFFSNDEKLEKIVDDSSDNQKLNSNTEIKDDEVIVKENNDDNNLFFDNIDDENGKNIDSKEELNNLFFNDNENQKNSFDDLNIGSTTEVKGDEAIVEETITDNNLFFNNNIQSDGNADSSLEQEKTSDEQNVQQDTVILEPNNSIFANDVVETPDYSKADLFENKNQENGESINQMLVENRKKKLVAEDKKTLVDSVSPFFQTSGEQLEKIEESIFDNRISFDQTKNVNSKLEKIDFSKTKNFNVKLVKKPVPLSKFIIGVISYAFFIFLILILITLLTYVLDIRIRAAKGDYSAPTFNAYVVLTGSMLPEIQVKDVVVTKKVDADTLKTGDIITFASSDSRFTGTIITHRILKKNQDSDGNITFQTKGDNNNVADSALVQPNNIYGKVILKIPKLGYLQDFLATQGGWIIVILLPCVTVISYDVVKLVKGLKRKKNKIKVIK